MVLHAFLQRANALAEALSKFRQLLGTKDKKSNEKDDQQVHRLKQTFKHKTSKPNPLTLPEADYSVNDARHPLITLILQRVALLRSNRPGHLDRSSGYYLGDLSGITSAVYVEENVQPPLPARQRSRVVKRSGLVLHISFLLFVAALGPA